MKESTAKVADRESLYENAISSKGRNYEAHTLRIGDTLKIDSENIAQEIESLGLSQKRELGSRLAVLIAHLIEWDQQPDTRTPSWRD